jgi:hypothetical protein
LIDLIRKRTNAVLDDLLPPGGATDDTALVVVRL